MLTRKPAFGDLYRDYMTDPDTIYIKIDDDIIFIDDYAIPELVRTTLEHPEAYDGQFYGSAPLSFCPLPY